MTGTRKIIIAFAVAAHGAFGCKWPQQSIKIMPLNHGWSFCCPGLDGTKSYTATASFKSVDNDNYSIRPGISSMQLSNSCENHIDKWYDEQEYSDNFPHSSSGSYGPANFQTETVALVFWCHNKVTQCQLTIDSVEIAEKGNTTLNGTRFALA